MNIVAPISIITTIRTTYERISRHYSPLDEGATLAYKLETIVYILRVP